MLFFWYSLIGDDRLREVVAHEGSTVVITELNQQCDVFERRASTRSELFSLLICLDATKFVWLSVFTLTETICPKVCSKSQLKCAKISLRIDVRRSKRSLLNYLLFKTSLEYKKADTAYPTCQCFT